MGFDKDFNHDANLTRDQVEQSIIGLSGWSIRNKRNFDFVVPIGTELRLRIRANDRLNFYENGNGNGLYSFSMVDATHVKWKYNNNAWNDNGGIGYAVVCDGETWNYNKGSCGFDIIVSATVGSGDACAYFVGKGIRLAGGEMIATGVADQLAVHDGYFLLQDRWVDLDGTTINGLSDEDIIYVKITESEVDYTSDSDLEHRLPDGRLYPICPTATQVTYEILSCGLAALPDDTSIEKHIVLGVVKNDAGAITSFPIWQEPCDLQLLYKRISPIASEPWFDSVFVIKENILGEGQFSTFAEAFNLIKYLDLPKAEIHVMGGTYTEDISLPSGFNTNLVIKGFGGAEIVGDFDLDNIKTIAPDGSLPSKEYTLRIKDLTITGQVLRTTAGNDGMVSFQNCSIQNNGIDAATIDVRSGTGSNPIEFLLRLEGCFVSRDIGTSELVYIGTDGVNNCTLGFHFIDTIFSCDTCISVNGLIKFDYSATLDTIPWLMTKCTAETSAAINMALLVNTGTYKTLTCTYLMYYAAAITGTLDVEVGSVDTNTLMPHPPLTMHE